MQSSPRFLFVSLLCLQTETLIISLNLTLRRALQPPVFPELQRCICCHNATNKKLGSLSGARTWRFSPSCTSLHVSPHISFIYVILHIFVPELMDYVILCSNQFPATF